MSEKIVLTDEEAVATVKKYAEQKDISAPQAAASLIRTAKGRINAVRKWASENRAAKAKGKGKGKAKAKVAKTAKPKAKIAKPKVEVVAVEEAPAE